MAKRIGKFQGELKPFQWTALRGQQAVPDLSQMQTSSTCVQGWWIQWRPSLKAGDWTQLSWQKESEPEAKACPNGATERKVAMLLLSFVQDYLFAPRIFSIYKDTKSTSKQIFRCWGTGVPYAALVIEWMTVVFTSPRISQPALHARCSWTAASHRSAWASSPSAAWRWRPASLGPRKAPHLTGCHWAHPPYPGVAWTQETQPDTDKTWSESSLFWTAAPLPSSADTGAKKPN